jgi:putative proteasome-type protease
MTYCLAIQVKDGIAFASDTRSNAGVDYVSAYRKLHRFKTAANNVVVLLAAGSLATTQEVVSRIQRDLEQNAVESLNAFQRLFEIAAYVGKVSQAVQQSHQPALARSGISCEASFIVGGQVQGEAPGIYLVYPQGNFIRASDDTPYLQIGENKYGKPMLDRLVASTLTLDQAVRLCVLSLIATIKSNVTVGPPLDLGIYRADSFKPPTTGRLGASDVYYRHITETWDEALREAFIKLPSFQWPERAHAPLEFNLQQALAGAGGAVEQSR